MIYYKVSESFEYCKILTMNSLSDNRDIPEIYQPLIQYKEEQFLELVNDKIKDAYNRWEDKAGYFY